MPNPTLTNWTILLPQPPNPPSFLVTGSNFVQGITHFKIDDASPNANPRPVWTPEDELPSQIRNNGTQAIISSKPSMPNGGAFPDPGELRLGVYAFGQITPTLISLTKPFPYTGMIVEHPLTFPTIANFSPVTYALGTEVTLLLNGAHFNHETVVKLKEVYVCGVCWEVIETKPFSNQILIVIATVTQTSEQIPGPGYLDVTVIGRASGVKSEIRKPVNYEVS
jgi:hypothetical protein